MVQIFEDTQEVKDTTVLKAPSLKILQCLGTLVSKDHILTTKLCFGTIDNSGEFKQEGSIFDTCDDAANE